MGGLQKSGLVTVRALQKAGFDVDLCLLYSGRQFFIPEDELVVYSPSKQSKNLVIKWFQVLWHVLRSVNQSKAKKVIVFGRYYGAITSLALLFNRKTQLWISERNSPHFLMSKGYETFCELAYVLRVPYGVLAQTRYAAVFQKNRYPGSNVVIFPNLFEAVHELSSSIPDFEEIQAESVDTNRVEFSSEIRGISVESEPIDKKIHTENDLMGKKRIVFLVAGRFNDILKGIPDVLEAFLRVNDSRLTLMVAGGLRGEDKAIDEVMDRYGDSAPGIVFLGKVEDMSMVYTKADIFILPSNSEGFPNALVEAMQRGLCCITAEFHPGVFEIIDGETNGIVVPRGDVSAIESVIKKVIEGKIDIVALGKNAKETVKKFEINQRLAELREVFDAH